MNRRPVVVLAALLGAMTICSTVLLALEPGPVTRQASPIDLRVENVTGRMDPVLFDTAQPRDWRAIVIYESGDVADTAQSIANRHAAQGFNGLGYHFVIQRDGGPNEMIQVGYRWPQQLAGNQATGPYYEWYNRQGISICLVGDSRHQPPTDAQVRCLTELVQRLQRRFQIPDNHVKLHADTDDALTVGRFFPLARFRDRLLTER